MFQQLDMKLTLQRMAFLLAIKLSYVAVKVIIAFKCNGIFCMACQILQQAHIHILLVVL